MVAKLIRHYIKLKRIHLKFFDLIFKRLYKKDITWLNLFEDKIEFINLEDF